MTTRFPDGLRRVKCLWLQDVSGHLWLIERTWAPHRYLAFTCLADFLGTFELAVLNLLNHEAPWNMMGALDFLSRNMSSFVHTGKPNFSFACKGFVYPETYTWRLLDKEQNS